MVFVVFPTVIQLHWIITIMCCGETWLELFHEWNKEKRVMGNADNGYSSVVLSSAPWPTNDAVHRTQDTVKNDQR